MKTSLIFASVLTAAVAVSGAALVLNVAIFEAGLRAGLPHYLLAQAVATAVVTVGNWVAYRRWAFRR